jgi:bifunctional NMN adenylyltransferase/nudix hydrolase
VKLHDYDIGVIVGRFQVPELHEAHVKLIDEVRSRHKKCIICVGIAPTLNTKRDPLDYANRYAMINAIYGGEVVIVPILDVKSDYGWSGNLDSLIRSIHPNGSICLYGGRDSFIKHYFGKFDCYEFPIHDYRPGTQIREEVGKKIIGNSINFRKGIIYATQNKYPVVYPVVDIAVVDLDKSKVRVLLGRKKGEVKFRFPGGFVNLGETFKEACFRELQEEAGDIEVRNLQYISSYCVDDWRYKGSGDYIISAFHSVDYKCGDVVAGDDLEKVKWVGINDFYFQECLIIDHIPMYEDLLSFLKNIGGKNNGR